MRTVFVRTVVIVALIAHADVSAAQKRSTKTTPHDSSQSKPIDAPSHPVPFDLATLKSGRVDPHFSGVPIADIVEALEKTTQLKKGEFESTVDFTARKDKALSGKLLGNIGVDDLVALTLPVPKNGLLGGCGPRYEYNPDTGEARLFAAISYNRFNGIGAANYHYGDGRDYDNLTLGIVFGNSNTYEASNAYGAEVTVKEITAKRYGIVTPGAELGSSRSSSCLSREPLFKLSMASELAAKELPSLKVLVVAKMQKPYLVYHFDHAKPTREDPTELTVRWVYLSGEVVAAAFYSGISGNILARFPETTTNESSN